MALPLLLGIGAGILGGTSFLMSKYNEGRGERSIDRYADQLDSSYLGGTELGNSLLAQAQGYLDDAGFIDWAEGTPIRDIRRMEGALFQAQANYQANEIQRDREMQANAVARGDYLAEQWRVQEQDAVALQANTLGLLETLENGTPAARTQAMLMWAQNMGMGALQGPDQKLIEGIGGVPEWFSQYFNGLVEGKTFGKEVAQDIANQVVTAYNPEYNRLLRAQGTYQDLWEQAQTRYGQHGGLVGSPFRLGGQYDPELFNQPFEYRGQRGNPAPKPKPAPTAVDDPNFDPEAEAAANARGRTTIKPNQPGPWIPSGQKRRRNR